jgi:hypothetical protein
MVCAFSSMPFLSTRIANKLERATPLQQNTWAIVAAFGTYFCMYAFRKPFAAGTYDSMQWLGLDFKILLILTQVAGYTLSKFLGIRIISQMPASARIACILGFIAIAELALLAFAVVPHPYHFVCLFFNGLPLGMIWGLVFSFLEGRRWTEILGAGLSASFIVSSGVVKSTGKALLNEGVISEFWMPAATGALYTIPLLLFVWMLAHIPAPTQADIEQRTERVAMTAQDRWFYIKNLGFGLLCLIVFHMLLTAYRDFRDNFSVELLDAIGFAGSAANLSKSEVVIAFAVLIALALLYRIKSNTRALQVSHGMMIAGVLLTGGPTVLLNLGHIHPYLWYLLVGLGLYLAYVPIQSMYFDRLIAVFRHKSNAGFLIYLADATGYLAAVLILLYKNFWAPDISWLHFFSLCSYGLSIIGTVLIVLAILFYQSKHPQPGVPLSTNKP